ncbi:MAG: nucleotide exchange factor GrpE, partial [Minisyncoccia bacterium]
MSDDKIKKLEEELAAIKAQAKEYLDGWKRAKADYLNREKEIEKEKIAWIKFANLELILNLLLILDSFEQSVKQISEELKDNEWVKGILKIKEQFENFLKLQGVERIKTIGEKFNPDFHEVIEKRGGEG